MSYVKGRMKGVFFYQIQKSNNILIFFDVPYARKIGVGD